MAGEYKLTVPLDASGVEDFKPDQPVKVVVVDGKGKASATVAKLDAKGHGTATFEFKENPGALRVLLGPESASNDEMQGLQTIGVDVAARQFAVKDVKLAPIAISTYYWRWWPIWCRTFTITGRVQCADGRPVPGATVCASDVSFWWWWLSKHQVGCATTDASGSFKIQFRWCCGFFPWWWWRRRFWQYEPLLGNLIGPIIRRDPKLKLPIPTPDPDPGIFKNLLSPLRSAAPSFPEIRTAATFDPGALAGLQLQLEPHLPAAPELQRIRLWPWYPWAPWLDCAPDIVFRVTQPCEGKDVVIVDENIFQTRWDIGTNLNVNLIANQEACCIPPDNRPDGNCIVISTVCGSLINAIGGNTIPALPAAPTDGFLNPGLPTNDGDRPYAGSITIGGLFGHGANAGYYEFEWSNGGAFNPMPPGAAGGFSRSYWGPRLGGGPVNFYSVPFPVTSISGQNVIESRNHFEANNDPASWGVTRFWVSNVDILMVWNTETFFADGKYRLHVKSYPASGAGLDLAHAAILNVCDTNEQNRLVITLDNRLNPDPAHPTAPDHPCGGGTVHLCVTEPDTDIINVTINGAKVGPCDFADAKNGGTLDIDFLVTDPDAHLHSYSLIATYGENLAVDLLGAPGATLTGVPGTQPGPDYARALTQGATPPAWSGGTFHLHIPNIRRVFPKTCCYQLELRAYKRTIVGCYSGLAHNNLSEYSFMVIV
ncbi:MAG: carboxypeptidase regulatory-like domain-containing protein [Acidobacteria bacterium]|nr:carboxypeptidase regulatory-like domain-containing protein [Acidobacteriota bacterium]